MTNEQVADTDTRRRRGRKPYPTLKFERALELPRAINEYGVDGRIRRLTLFDQLGRSPSSGNSRLLITTSTRYGLTKGSYGAEHLELTDIGEAIISGDFRNSITTLNMAFNQAITITTAFEAAYNQLKNNQIPRAQVLQDLLAQEGIDQTDCEEAAVIFLDNIRYIGLAQEQTGSEYIIPIEQRIEELQLAARIAGDESTINQASDSAQEEEIEQKAPLSPGPYPVSNTPELHIDVQIHIDSSASAEQIDQIFASMAKHLYGREV